MYRPRNSRSSGASRAVCWLGLSYRRSSTGTPRISAVTIAGGGYTRSAVTSIFPAGAIASSKRSTISCICESQNFDAARRKRGRCQTARPGMGRRVQEQHLFHHDCRDGSHGRQCHGGQLIRGGRAIGGKMVQNMDHVLITRDHLRAQERVPVNRVFSARTPIQRMRVGQHFRVEQLIQAQLLAVIISLPRRGASDDSPESLSPDPRRWAPGTVSAA
jgi:hypothetical protein